MKNIGIVLTVFLIAIIWYLYGIQRYNIDHLINNDLLNELGSGSRAIKNEVDEYITENLIKLLSDFNEYRNIIQKLLKASLIIVSALIITYPKTNFNNHFLRKKISEEMFNKARIYIVVMASIFMSSYWWLSNEETRISLCQQIVSHEIDILSKEPSNLKDSEAKFIVEGSKRGLIKCKSLY